MVGVGRIDEKTRRGAGEKEMMKRRGGRPSYDTPLKREGVATMDILAEKGSGQPQL